MADQTDNKNTEDNGAPDKGNNSGGDGQENIQAAKLEAIMFLLFSAVDEQDLVEKRKQAEQIKAMSDDQIRQLSQMPTTEKQPRKKGDLIRNMR